MKERYKAFISYSQKDLREARKLQSWLERYRLPKRETTDQNRSRKLGLFFRDETDLTASPELWDSLKSRIQASESLIVLCSPHAANSRWVEREIVHFRKTGRGGQIFALIITGEPNSSDPSNECFPPSFRSSENGGIEPMAASLLKDGAERSYIRLAAGLMKLPFDSLWQRERRRQQQRTLVGAGLAVLGTVLTILAMLGGWYSATGAASEAHAKSDILARAAMQIFDDDNGDVNVALLMALQADPSAQRNLLRRLFNGTSGYPIALTSLSSIHLGGRPTLELRGHEQTVGVLKLYQDGIIMSGSGDKTIRLWDLNSGEEIARLDDHLFKVLSIDVTRDGNIVSSDAVGTVRFFDATTGQTTREFSAGESAVYFVSTVLPGKLITIAYDQPISIWDLSSEELLYQLADSEDGFFRAFVTPDGRLVAGTTDGDAVLWDLETGEQVTRFEGHSSPITDFEVTTQGFLVTGSTDRTVRVWDMESGAEIKRFDGHSSSVTTISPLADDTLYTATSEGTGHIWDLDSGDEVKRFSYGGQSVWSSEFVSDGRLIIGMEGGRVRVEELYADPRSKGLDVSGSAITFMSFSSESQLYTGSRDGVLRLWNPATLELRKSIRVPGGQIRAGLVLKNGLVAIGSDDGFVRVLDVGLQGGLEDRAVQKEAGILLREDSTKPAGNSRVPFSELIRIPGTDERAAKSLIETNKGHLVVGYDDGTLSLWDLSKNEKVQDFKGHWAAVWHSVIARDNQLITASWDGTVRIWDLESGEEMIRLGDEENWSPYFFTLPLDDGKIATGSLDGVLRIWDFEYGEEVMSFPGHQGGVTSIVDLNNGILATGSGAGVVRLFDLNSEELLYRFPDQYSAIEFLATDDRSRLFAGTNLGELRIWDVPRIVGETAPSEKVKLVCDRLIAAGAKLAFTTQEIVEFPVLRGEPVDFDTGDLLSPCKDHVVQ